MAAHRRLHRVHGMATLRKARRGRPQQPLRASRHVAIPRRWCNKTVAPLARTELAGLHLAVDLQAEELPATPAASFCDSKAALLCLQNPDRASLGVTLLYSRLTALRDGGCTLSLHWLPAHVGILGNKEADTRAKSAHHTSVPHSPAVTAVDFSRHRRRRHIIACHPDKRVSLGRPPRPLPQHGLPRRDASLLLRLRVGCYWMAARRHPFGKATSPACAFCGEAEILEHLLLVLIE
ncbi:uncharacterized protein LOC142564982 [Dermacentor variabilis]|uniref:uncharacterized protein LOC142564982 n=1 Tax=Dermacentor variabilis TaxID=34621 RepID=UPI003F5C1C0B